MLVLQHSGLLLLLLCHHAAALTGPVAWSIAGSDSGGGAGVEADLKTIHSLGVHGCSVVTALTAQNSLKVSAVCATPADHLGTTLRALESDFGAPASLKIGMLCGASAVTEVADCLERIGSSTKVVLDPVLISSSGTRLLDDAGLEVLRSRLLGRCDLLTPNAREAEFLLGWADGSICDAEEARRAGLELLSTGVKAVLLKGGHWGSGMALDFYASSDEEWWLSLEREQLAFEEQGAHGTGCILSSAVTASLARGETMLDSVVIAKGFCASAIRGAYVLGEGPPCAAIPREWPSREDECPRLYSEDESSNFFKKNVSMSGLYALAGSAERCEELFDMGIVDVQLRVKNASREELEIAVQRAAKAAGENRLWVNDDWRLAVKFGAFGAHLGQEDLAALSTADRRELKKSGLGLGISTHSMSELGIALAWEPSYVALGPVYGTTSKHVPFSPRGEDMVRDWRTLLPPQIPLVAIGGITLNNAQRTITAGADSIAVISALPHRTDDDDDNLRAAIQSWADLDWSVNEN